MWMNDAKGSTLENASHPDLDLTDFYGTACASDGGNKGMSDSALSPEAQKNNALLAPWSGLHGGVPPFDRVKVADFKPALEFGMAQKRAEIKAIAEIPEAPTFENTVASDSYSQSVSRVLAQSSSRMAI
jgi:peptidyl-dipeptidase Dcp